MKEENIWEGDDYYLEIRKSTLRYYQLEAFTVGVLSGAALVTAIVWAFF